MAGPMTLFGDLGKPATALIEKISGGIGGLARPFQIKRVARAEAEAEVIRAHADIEIEDLHRRALVRFVSEEGRNQVNMENIIAKAIEGLAQDSSPQEMENDWIANFFDKCRLISDSEMQELWSKVLSGEANSPGAFSKRTVNLLSSLDKVDGQVFTKLCGFSCIFDAVQLLLVWEHQDAIYKDNDVNFEALTHLASIGLITFESLGGFSFTHDLDPFTAVYYDRTLNAEVAGGTGVSLNIGKALFSESGRELASICGAKPVDDFYDYMVANLAVQGLVLSSPWNSPVK